MDLELLPGEGVNAFTSDVQDSTGKIYPLRVEYLGQVPDFPGITMIVVRLADDLGNVGDVLLRELGINNWAVVVSMNPEYLGGDFLEFSKCRGFAEE